MCSRASFLNPRASVGHRASGAESVGHRAWAAESAGYQGSGRGERSPSFPLAVAEKQGNDSLKANHYLWVMLCCVLRARYY